AAAGIPVGSSVDRSIVAEDTNPVFAVFETCHSRQTPAVSANVESVASVSAGDDILEDRARHGNARTFIAVVAQVESADSRERNSFGRHESDAEARDDAVARSR